MSRKPLDPEIARLIAAVDISEMNDDPIDDPDNPEWTEEDFARAQGPESFPDQRPVELPTWHLEPPLRYPQVSFQPPDSLRAYSFRQRATFPMKTPVLEKPTDSVESKILTVRGRKVILDADLAALYGVETKALNRAVKRNSKRFPSDFVFQLSSPEAKSLRCQFGTSNPAKKL